MSRPRVRALNLGQLTTLEWNGRKFRSGIVKRRSVGPVAVTRDGLEGDAIADRSVHGGPDKAVYAYPSEHYPWWSEALDVDLEPGAFGENLTLEGVLETDLFIGDRLRLGSVSLVVTQPRLPCVKLAARFQRADVIRRFVMSQRSGFYLRVEAEGTITPGSELSIERNGGVSVQTVFEMMTGKGRDRAVLERALAHADLGGAAPVELSSLRGRLGQ